MTSEFDLCPSHTCAQTCAEPPFPNSQFQKRKAARKREGRREGRKERKKKSTREKVGIVGRACNLGIGSGGGRVSGGDGQTLRDTGQLA